MLWNESVLPALSGLAKAMFQSARLASLVDGVAVVQVENDHHRQNGERKRADLEAALGSATGSSVRVRLEVDASASTSHGAPPAGDSARAPRASTMSDDPDEHLGGADVHDLDDAPDAPLGGVAALTEAFPGTEVLEE